MLRAATATFGPYTVQNEFLFSQCLWYTNLNDLDKKAIKPFVTFLQMFFFCKKEKNCGVNATDAALDEC